MKAYFYDNFAEYEQDEAKNAQDDIVAVVRNEKYGTLCADITTSCKSHKTAIRRLFKGINAVGCAKHFDGWDEALLESAENGVWGDKETIWDSENCKSVYIPGGYHYSIEEIEKGFWYVEVSC